MYPSLSKLKYSRSSTYEPFNSYNSSHELYESLPEELKLALKGQLLQSPDCFDVPKWCSLMKCDERFWETAARLKGWIEKPARFSWRIWFARKCNPNWATKLDEQLFSLTTDDLEPYEDLILRGADISADGDTLIRSAVKEGKFNIVELLIQHGSQSHLNDAELLSLACQSAGYRTVEVLLKYGANPNSNHGLPIVYASSRDLYGVVKLLLDYGADPDAADEDKRALLYSVSKGNYKIVELLLQYGADLSYLDRAQVLLKDVHEKSEWSEKYKKTLGLLRRAGYEGYETDDL